MSPKLNNRPGSNLLRCAFFLACLIVGTGTSTYAGCRVPHYRKGYVSENSASSIMINVSVAMKDFVPERLACLATALRQRYAGRKSIDVWVYSTHAAARFDRVPEDGDTVKPNTPWDLQIHGFYSFHADKHDERVELLPFGNDRSFETVFNLPVTVIPPCTLEIKGRCLLALDHIAYPGDALQAHVSGRATVSGTIARSGKMKDVKAVAPSTNTDIGNNALMIAALANLKTWRFEPASHEDSVRIVYSYQIVNPPGLGGTVGLQIHLPDQIVIQGKPLR